MRSNMNYRIILIAVFSGVGASAALADDNCGDVKNGLTQQFPIVHWGFCFHPLPPSADAEGALLCAKVIAGGGIPTESGHRTVSNWKTIFGVRVPLPNTYLGFCGGVKVAGAATLDANKEAEVKKEIQDALDKMKQ